MLIQRDSYLFIICLLANTIALADNKTATINISATIITACEAGTTTGSGISFGTLDFGIVADLSSPVTATGQANSGAIRIKCTNNTTYVIYLDAGLHSPNTNLRYLSNGTAQVGYNLYTDASRTNIWNNTTGLSKLSNGQETWIPVYGMVFQQASTPIGTYTDRVNITILY